VCSVAPGAANHVWSYDVVKVTTHDGRVLRILVVIDEYTRECLALRVALPEAQQWNVVGLRLTDQTTIAGTKLKRKLQHVNYNIWGPGE
jgi:hypothetical protein